VRWLTYLLDPAYLYAQNSTPEGRLSALSLTWVGLLLGLALVAWRWLERERHEEPTRPGYVAGDVTLWPALMLCCSALGAVLVLVRPMVTGALSARVWGLSLSVAAVAAPLGHLVERATPRVMACVSGRTWICVVAVALHCLGLLALATMGGRGLWPAAIVVAALAACSLRRPRRLRVVALWPMAVAYTSVLAVYALQDVCGLDLGPYRGFPYADPWSPWFHPATMTVAGLAGTLVWTLATVLRSERATLHTVGAVLAAFASAFYVLVLRAHLSHGATGSDPYCYLQMTADLIERSTPLHEFPLLALAQRVGIPTWPVVHVGYHPVAGGDLAATVWPLGWPALMAPLYALAGERGALLAAPLWALLSAGLTWSLARWLRPEMGRPRQWLAGGLAAFILLTSLEGVLRTLVPMADAAAQALAVATLLALVCFHRARSVRDALLWAGLGGLALGMGYLVRHPQLPLALAALPLALSRRHSRARRGWALVAFGGTTLIMAIPDLYYHARVFGSWLHAESPEWHLLHPVNILRTASPMLREVLARPEFGYLAPWALYGAWRQWRRAEDRAMTAAMWLGFVGVLAFNLSYSAVRLRDLMALFPWLALWAAYGVEQAWAVVRCRTLTARVLVVAAVVGCLAARTTGILRVPWHPVIWTFGLVTERNARAYQDLASALPSNALVFTGLGSGAVERYTGRLTARPASWTDEEFAQFRTASLAEGYALYVLEDGEEMEEFISRAHVHVHPEHLAAFDVPTMARGGHVLYRPAHLYRLAP